MPIGERMRAPDGGPVDSASWLAPIEAAGEADRQPAVVANKLTREELAEQLESQSQRPLGTLPVPVSDYVRLLPSTAQVQSPNAAP